MRTIRAMNGLIDYLINQVRPLADIDNHPGSRFKRLAAMGTWNDLLDRVRVGHLSTTI